MTIEFEMSNKGIIGLFDKLKGVVDKHVASGKSLDEIRAAFVCDIADVFDSGYNVIPYGYDDDIDEDDASFISDLDIGGMLKETKTYKDLKMGVRK